MCRALTACMLQRSSLTDSAPVLRVSPTFETISVAGQSFGLRGREALRRVLEALVRARRESGCGCSVDTLFDAAWPADADATPALRGQRVYAALSRLRRLGLQGVIVRAEDGYVIDPGWRIELDGSVARMRAVRPES